MHFFEQGICLEEALLAFDFGGEVAGALRYGEGHINDTFAVYTQQKNNTAKRFILQRINQHVFKNSEELMENIVGVTDYLRKIIADTGGDADRETLTVLRPKTGGNFFTSKDGGIWRSYLFIEDAISFQKADTLDVFKATAAAFGNFARQLEKYPAHTLHETIKDFHDTRVRFDNFKKVLGKDKLGRAKECAKEIDFVLQREQDCSFLMDLLEKGELPLRVTHNDTKLNNIMMDPVAIKGVCVIDLDTVMPGLSLNDFGDAIRFGASTAAEDEKDLSRVNFSLPLFETYVDGYLQAVGSSITAKEKEQLCWGAKLMTLECGIRFLTDHLEGDVYFKIHRPEHNLDRARTQLKLVADMENFWDEMDTIVKKYS